MTEPGLRPRRGAHRAPRSRLEILAPLIGALVLALGVVGAVQVFGGDEESITEVNDAAIPSATVAPSAAEPVPSPVPSPAAPVSEQPARERFEVIVLNQTRRPLLAASVAETVRAAGWVVASTGNFAGNVPATTVYFPSGGEAAATEIAAVLPVEPRVLPVFPAIDAERITVVVTDNFP